MGCVRRVFSVIDVWGNCATTGFAAFTAALRVIPRYLPSLHAAMGRQAHVLHAGREKSAHRHRGTAGAHFFRTRDIPFLNSRTRSAATS